MRGFFNFAMERDLTPSQLGTLMRMYHRGARRGLQSLRSETGKTNAAISQMIDRLVQRGLVERTEAPEDRRSKHICLTAQGSALVEECGRFRLHWVDEALRRLSPEELAVVARGLSLLLEKASAGEGEARC
jgi:DNA-binding MarR family transcriptional regulator